MKVRKEGKMFEKVTILSKEYLTTEIGNHRSRRTFTLQINILCLNDNVKVEEVIKENKFTIFHELELNHADIRQSKVEFIFENKEEEKLFNPSEYQCIFETKGKEISIYFIPKGVLPK